MQRDRLRAAVSSPDSLGSTAGLWPGPVEVIWATVNVMESMTPLKVDRVRERDVGHCLRTHLFGAIFQTNSCAARSTWRLLCSSLLGSILQSVKRKQVRTKKELHRSLQVDFLT